MDIELRMYETPDGRIPFSEWMDSIEGDPIYEIVMRRLDIVERGSFGHHRSVGEGVIELKIDFSLGYRVYLGRDGAELVVLLIGGHKGTQDRDIRTAKNYWKHYNA